MNKEFSISEGMKKVLYPILSFVLPSLIMIAGLAALLVTPFGDKSLALFDGQWYVNSELFLGRLLNGQENILYSFNNGLGGNEWSILAWGGFDIGGLLLSRFGTLDSMPTLFTWICVVNAALCGLTMYALLAYLRGHQLSNLIFSTSYALIGFNVVNCYQTLFFIGPQILPLMALGLVKLLRGESPLVYILSFAFCTLLNFYFGFILAVASVVMRLAILYAKKGEEGRCAHPIRTYAISSFIGGLLPAFFWLPALKAYSGGGRLDQTGLDEFLFSENMPFIQMFSKLFSGANSANEVVTGMPNIFCGILVVALAILFFMNKDVSQRCRRAVAVVLVFYLITFYITAFTLVMHGGTHTNWFPFRYSFVFSFILIGVAAEQFGRLSETTLQDTKRCGAVLIVATLIIFSTRYEFISGGTVLLDLALLLAMWAAFRMHKLKPEKAPYRALVLFFLLFVSGNLYVNYVLSVGAMEDVGLDLEAYSQNAVVTGALTEGVAMTDESFYRLEKDVSESGTVGADAYLYDYNGVSHSGPAERMFVHKQLNKLGVNWYDMRHYYAGGIPAATDSLLGVKYLISSRDLSAEKGYTKRAELGDLSVYENPDALSVAILANEEARDIELGNNAFENLNSVWKGMTGTKADVFTPAEDITFRLHNVPEYRETTSEDIQAVVEEIDEWGFEGQASDSSEAASSASESADQSNHDDHAYVSFEFEAEQEGPVYLFNIVVPVYGNGTPTPQMLNAGVFETGDSVSGDIPLADPYVGETLFEQACAMYAMDYADNEVLQNCASILQERPITFEVQNETNPHGSFTADEDQIILFTIPWDEGWTCYIDGQEVPIAKTWDLFMSVEAPQGSHTYELRFFPAWMNYGLMISGAALVALVLFMLIRHRKRAANPSV